MDRSSADETFLREAIRLSRDRMRAGRGGPFGAVIVRDGAIVARGWNRVTTANDPTAHAEVVAIRRACTRLGSFSLAGCTLYTSCEPCPMCLGAAYWARIDRLGFAASRLDAAAAGFDDARIYDEIGLAHADRSLPTSRALRDEATLVLDEWTTVRDKVAY